MEAATTFKGGRIRKGWELTKSAWRVLKLDKELVAIPALSMLVSLLVIVVMAAGALAYMLQGQSIVDTDFNTLGNDVPSWLKITYGAVFYLVLTFIANIFNGAIIYGATERFNGGDPTVRSSIKGAMRKFKPLLLFSILMSTVGLVLQAIEERVPFGGKIAVWLVSASWTLANVFAIPVIVLSDKNVQPLQATKESVRVIRKVWGEGVIAQFSIAIIGLFAVLTYAIFWALLGSLIFAVTGATVVGIVYALTAFFGLVALLLTISALSSIIKAALYHFAVTGTAPEVFNQELLRSSMTPKKARKIFA